MKQLIKTTLTLSIILLLAACGQEDGEGKQNSEHGLLNTPPVAQVQSLTLKEDTTKSVVLSATDAEGDDLEYKITTKPMHGKLTGTAPSLTYVPSKDYNGKDSFSFKANDGLADSEEATVSFSVAPVADLIALTLTLDKSEANKDSNVSYTVTPKYDEGELSDVQKNLEGLTITSDISDAIYTDINQKSITTKQDGNLTITAKIDNIVSSPVALNVYWEVNGYRLPPEPDKALNDSTLLGIDANHNGVRDDVERWIYERYSDKHPIHIDIAMQAARGYRLVLEHPERAKEIHGEVSAAMSCESYYQIYAKYFNEPILVKEDINTGYFRHKIYFNTKERMDAYDQYDTLLSGDSYTLSAIKEKKMLCDFNASKYNEE